MTPLRKKMIRAMELRNLSHRTQRSYLRQSSFKGRKANQVKYETITAVEFIRRFLLHSLPQGFVRIRHYGFLANRNRKDNLTKIHRLLGLSLLQTEENASIEEMMLKLTGIDITLCPCCKRKNAPRCRDTKIRR